MMVTGDPVSADPNIPCDRCQSCQHNAPNQCQNLQAIGVTRDGAFAEYVSVPEAVTFSIGEISYQDTALIEPLACVVCGLQRVQIADGDRALILGAGLIGALLAQAVSAAGAAQADITDINPWRLSLMEDFGVDHAVLSDDLPKEVKSFAPEGYEVVIDATGVPMVITLPPVVIVFEGWLRGE